VTCDHSAAHSGGARYLPQTGQLRLVLVCDECGSERGELSRIDYSPNARLAVGRLAELTARELGLSEARAARVRFATLVCGIGRDRIRPEILSKRGPLSADEWTEIYREPEFAAAMLGASTLADVREWILCHRERPDGSGYPRGLSAEEIPLEARILAVTEAYAAMIGERPYRVARDHQAACAELLRCAGSQFDDATVQAFLRASRERGPQLADAVA
jgi:HD-GYP domain-containing protein (c-di-GMP phosphodiesterase class II)